jgi:hypothetical protein
MNSIAASIPWAAAHDLPSNLGRVTCCTPGGSCSRILCKYLHLPDDECSAVLDIIVPNSGGIGLTAVNRDFFRPAVAADRLGEEALGRRFVPMCREKKIDGLPARIHGTVAIIPVALNANIGFVHAPAELYGSLAGVKGLLPLRTHLPDSPVDRRVIDRHGAFLHKCFDMAGAQWIRHTPADAP